MGVFVIWFFFLYMIRIFYFKKNGIKLEVIIKIYRSIKGKWFLFIVINNFFKIDYYLYLKLIRYLFENLYV